MADETRKRSGGRPPLDPDAPSVIVSTRVPVGTFDRLYARARAHRVTLGEYVRELLGTVRQGEEDEE